MMVRAIFPTMPVRTATLRTFGAVHPAEPIDWLLSSYTVASVSMVALLVAVTVKSQ